MQLPWIICGALLLAVLVLLFKIRFMKRALDEIGEQMERFLREDTNVSISVSTGDRHVRRLAANINRQLKLLRKQRLQYLNGDRELKEAVTNISHDLRTPLTAICGYLDLLERQETSEEVSRYLSYIENRTQALKQLTEELFRYSVILSTAGEMVTEAVNVNHVLEESIAAFYGALTERGIIPKLEITEEAVMRELNRAALSRVFGNILGNALKYSDGDLSVKLCADGTVAFSNTAKGLDGVQVGKLFDRFFSVEAARNSTGLGLAISKTLVEQMGGTITAAYKADVLTIMIRF